MCDFKSVSAVDLHILQSVLFILQGTEQTDMNGCCKNCKYESIKLIKVTQYYPIHF